MGRFELREFLRHARSAAVLISVIAGGCEQQDVSSKPVGSPVEEFRVDLPEMDSDDSSKPLAAPPAEWRVGPLGTAYYLASPAQGRPPDGEISPGTPVTLIEEAGSYSLIGWDGQSAWVASDSVQPIMNPPGKLPHNAP